MMQREQWHVFHFIGHARLVNGVPQLLLQYETAPPPGLPWELADILKDFRGVSPSFVFLNACHTVAETEVPEAWSMSDLFVGVVVIAIIGNAAEHFSAVMMAARDDMDAALAACFDSFVRKTFRPNDLQSAILGANRTNPV